MSTILKINGSTVDRPARRVVLNRLSLSIDGGDSLEFTERAVRLPGSFGARAPVELIVDGVTRFLGVVVGSYPSGIGSGPIDIGYRAMGLEWLVDHAPITNAAGSGQVAYNLDPGDLDYLPSLAGLSVGGIIKRLLDLHAIALNQIGVNGYNPLDLAALEVVPPEPIRLSGGLWTAIKGLLATWCNKYAAWIDPATQLIRVQSQLDLPPINLTLDVDPIVVGSLSRDHSECFPRVVVRGGHDVQAAYRTLAEETVEFDQTAADEAEWSLADYLQPRSGADVGTVTAMSSTTLTVQSDDPAREWAANHWNNIQAEVVAYDPAATGITFSESRRITACDALTPGGTAVLTVDQPFSNSGYVRYSIRGLSDPMSMVWRKLLVKPSALAQRLVKRFSHSVPWSPQDGVVTQTTSPQAVICWSQSGDPPYVEFPMTFDIVPFDGTTDGYIVFHEPAVKPFSSQQSLIDGNPDGIPSDIKILLPYSAGAMSIIKPDSGFEGTSNTVDGSEAVLTVDRPEWLDYRDRANYAKLAQEILDTVKDTVVEGSVVHYGMLPEVLTKGKSINLSHPDHATGLEAVNAPIRSVTLDYAPNGGPSSWIMAISFSNRLRPFSGDKLYEHAGWGQRGALEGAQLDMAAARREAARPEANHGGREAPPVAESFVDWPQSPVNGPSTKAAEFVGPPKPPQERDYVVKKSAETVRQEGLDKAAARQAEAAKVREAGEAKGIERENAAARVREAGVKKAADRKEEAQRVRDAGREKAIAKDAANARQREEIRGRNLDKSLNESKRNKRLRTDDADVDGGMA